MSAASQVIRPGGAIVMAAGCEDGLPDHGLYAQLLAEAGSPDAILAMLARPGYSAQDQWQVQIQAAIQKKADVYVYSDGLSDEQICRALFSPCRDIPAALQFLDELGVLKGIEDEMEVSERDAILTDPSAAQEFVVRTGCDSLAVAVGTSHGAYKFSGNQRLRLDRLAEIQRKLPGSPLVLHGASAIPRYEIERINAAGGELSASASGVSDTELAEAARCGVTKVNVGTDGRLIWTRVHREFFRDSPKQFDFMGPGRTYMEEYAVFVAEKCAALGSAGRSLYQPGAPMEPRVPELS